MRIQLKSRRDVRLFSLSITLVALVGAGVLQFLFLPSPVLEQVILQGFMITFLLAAPLTYFIGSKILQNHHLTLALEHTAEHDMLTDLATRLSFYRQLKDAGSGPFAVIIVDIDHFKSINDRYGHQVGDAALKQFSATLKRNCREDDIIARFGGEEFVLLLSKATLDNGMSAATRLCRRVHEKPMPLTDGTMLRITASFGVAELDHARNIEAAISRADTALYRAKATGRNRVCAFDPAQDLVAAAE